MKSNRTLINDFVSTTFEIKRLMHKKVGNNPKVNPASKLQFFALKTIEKNTSITVGELAEILMLTSSGVSQLIERLQNKKWITKEVDPLDGRKFNLRITKIGKKEASDTQRLFIENASCILKHISKEDLQTLIDIQTKLIKTLNNEKITSVS